MIQIDDKIVSLDIIQKNFCCDISKCLGTCCVEGNAGAPLEMDEVDILEQEFEAYKPYMTAEGVEEIERQGFMVVDCDGDYTTPLVNDAECAYSFSENGITLCAIERAYNEGKTQFIKPISCHLYPIRVANFNDGSVGLNYHRWGVCSAAVALGDKIGMPMYKALKVPIIRRFGAEFFKELEIAADFIANNKD